MTSRQTGRQDRHAQRQERLVEKTDMQKSMPQKAGYPDRQTDKQANHPDRHAVSLDRQTDKETYMQPLDRPADRQTRYADMT